MELKDYAVYSGFQYQLVGCKHATMLAISLFSLRRYHKDDPVHLLCGDEESFRVGMMLLNSSLGENIKLTSWDAPREGGKGQQHANKTLGVEKSPFDRTIFLDADTTIHSRLDPLWPTGDEVHLTRFSTWQTTGNTMKGRLNAWYHVMPQKVEWIVNHPLPAINTGVFSFSRRSHDYLSRWKEVTMMNPTFMSDELAAQLIFTDFPHSIHSDRWNFSPKYSTPNKIPYKVVHYHGFQHARPDKSSGYKIWLPLYLDWSNKYEELAREIPKDKHLRKYLETCEE